jgi:WD40-like Beta Propeller Repeat
VKGRVGGSACVRPPPGALLAPRAASCNLDGLGGLLRLSSGEEAADGKGYRSMRSALIAFRGVSVIALSALLVAVVLPSSSRSARQPWPAPRTLLRVGGLAGFAQDGDRIAWIDVNQPCARWVQIRNLATKATRPLLGRTGPTCNISRDLGGFGQRMAPAGQRALWSYFTVSLSHFQISLFTAAPGSRERSPAHFEVYGGFEDKDHAPPEVPMAGDRNALVFAGFEEETGPTIVPGSAFRVRYRSSAVRGTQLTSAVAAHGKRFSVARHRPRWCRLCNSDPNWSRDGTKLAFLGQRRTTAQDRRGVYELYVVDADGQNLRRLLPADKFSIIGWSSDGKSVFYTNGSGIFAVNLAGQSQRLTSTSVDIDNGNPVLSPDSLRVAFRGPGGELRVLGVSTGAEITVAVAPQGKGFDWIGWSPDGRTLGYLTGADQERGAELRIVPSSGGPAAARDDGHPVSQGRVGTERSRDWLRTCGQDCRRCN